MNPGSRISRYTILSLLGSGGMGEVYLARDTSLGRKVALKILPAAFSSDPEDLSRFIREAKAASALNHPNVAHIYEIGEENEIHFISMEYIEGQSLVAEITSPPVNFSRILDLAIQISDAVAHAHARGVIHRDIKPGNILITPSGTVKVLDFGLAKIVHAEDPSYASLMSTLSRTADGTIAGTVPYMSPEQLCGKDLDYRTDIFSVGSVVYEMVTARRAFPGATQAEVIGQILYQEPEEVIRLNSNTPLELVSIIGKCLQKDHKRRYHSAQELATELQTLQRNLTSQTAFVTRTPKPSIVVLPFEDISPGKDNQYFSDGLADEIISDLSQMEQLRVISRTSSMTINRLGKDSKTIAAELNVQYVLQGSVRKAGNQLRITAQLIDAASDTNVWAGKQNGTLENVFEIQEKVSRSIADALKVKLSLSQMQRIAERPMKNPRAYECYLRARYAMWSWKEEAFVIAEREVHNALDLEGKNELLYATLGWIQIMKMEAGLQSEAPFQLAEKCTAQVFELNPRSPYGYSLRGLIHYRKSNIQAAVQDLKQAHSMISNDPDILGVLSYCYILSGRQSVARPLVQALLEVDPLTPINHALLGALAYLDGSFELALDHYRKAWELGPEMPAMSLYYAWTLIANRRIEESTNVIDTLLKNAPQSIFARFGMLLRYASHGESERVLANVTPEVEEAGNSIEYFCRILADCYALAGAKNEAMDWLEKDIRLGFINYPYLAIHSRLLANLRGEDRFNKILEQVKKKWEEFEV